MLVTSIILDLPAALFQKSVFTASSVLDGLSFIAQTSELYVMVLFYRGVLYFVCLFSFKMCLCHKMPVSITIVFLPCMVRLWMSLFSIPSCNIFTPRFSYFPTVLVVFSSLFPGFIARLQCPYILFCQHLLLSLTFRISNQWFI